MEKLTIKFKKLSESAIAPQMLSEGAAGCDLFSVESYELKPGERHLFPTNISVEIPHGTYGRVAPRSGLAFKKGIDVLAGVIDADYRGDIGVVLINLGQEPIMIEKGERMAQFIIEKCFFVNREETQDEFSKTVRTDGGFGSTGRF